MKTLKRLVPNDFTRYSLIGIALFAVFLLAYPIGEIVGRLVYIATH